MTDNMEHMFETFHAALSTCFDKQYIEYLFEFSPIISVADFSKYLMLEMIKYSYFATIPKYPLRHFLHYSLMDFFEHTTIQELRIIKSFVENRLYINKKVSNQQFIEYYEEYDKWVENLILQSI